jgi:mono/diheme cytochrome c family protein
MKAGWTTALAAALAVGATQAAGAAQSDVARGKYLVTIMDCSGCHTPGALAGKPEMAKALSGSDIGFGAPGLGVFYPPNLTPDPETGLGKWSSADIVKAITTGVRPDGRELAPFMPYRDYAALTADDAAAIAAYLQSLPPTVHAVPDPVGPNAKPPSPYLSVTMP